MRHQGDGLAEMGFVQIGQRLAIEYAGVGRPQTLVGRVNQAWRIVSADCPRRAAAVGNGVGDAAFGAIRACADQAPCNAAVLVGQHQVVIKSLEQNYRRVSGISGATIMGDGRVALILDVSALIESARTAQQTAAAVPA